MNRKEVTPNDWCEHSQEEWEVREAEDGIKGYYCPECEGWIYDSTGDLKDLLELNPASVKEKTTEGDSAE